MYKATCNAQEIPAETAPAMMCRSRMPPTSHSVSVLGTGRGFRLQIQALSIAFLPARTERGVEISARAKIRGPLKGWTLIVWKTFQQFIFSLFSLLGAREGFVGCDSAAQAVGNDLVVVE
jgi:hypothetical protein